MIAFFEPIAGASGDMILGALLDAGLSPERLETALRTLPLPEWRLEITPTIRGGLGATRVRVISEERDPPHRRLADLLRIIDAATLPGNAQEQARAIVTLLAESEARVHRIAREDVHFHEVGGADAIVDICGAATGLALLGVDQMWCAPLPLNGGSVSSMHGILPLPAPATLELLARAGAPTVPHAARTELLTPTGAAILCALARFDRPAMRVYAVGYGAGSRTEPEPNVLRLTLGQPLDKESYASASRRANEPDPAPDEHLVMLECNLDDMNPQWYGHLFELLLGRGALDVTCAPLLMKKGRPGQLLGVLCLPDAVAALTALLLAETTTLGVRRYAVTRHAADRAATTVETPYGAVRIKLRLVDGRVTQAMPEYEDCHALAIAQGVPLATVSLAAQIAAHPLIDQPFERQ